jgi:hypothetical protein
VSVILQVLCHLTSLVSVILPVLWVSSYQTCVILPVLWVSSYQTCVILPVLWVSSHQQKLVYLTAFQSTSRIIANSVSNSAAGLTTSSLTNCRMQNVSQIGMPVTRLTNWHMFWSFMRACISLKFSEADLSGRAVCGRSLAAIVGSNPAGGMGVCVVRCK